MDVARVNITPWYPNFLNPEFDFATDTSSLPFSATIGVGQLHPLDASGSDARLDDYGTLIGVYVQDQWNPHPRWTFNLGIRYDAELHTWNNDRRVPWADSTALVNALGQEWLNTGDRSNDLNNIAPRISLNYDLFGTNRTVLRCGYGILFERTPYFIPYLERRDVSWRTYTINNPGTLDPDVLRQREAPPSINLLNHNMSAPQFHVLSFGVGHQISQDLSMNIDYLDERSNSWFTEVNVNYYKPSIGRRVLLQNFGDIVLWGNFASTRYHGLFTNVVYGTDNARLSLAYTLSWSYSDQDNYFPPVTDISKLNEQRSSSDERHRVVLSGGVSLPFGFHVSGIVTIASPHPFSVFVGRDLNDNSYTSDDWPNGERNQLPDVRKVRNWYKMVDVRISKVIEISSVTTEVIFEAFNAFNWFNASSYAGVEYDRKGNPLTSFGTPTGTYPPRQMQLGLRVRY